MRFNYPKQTYKDPTTNWFKWFAWFPVRVNDNECIWLEYVERLQIPSTYATQDDWTRYKYREIYIPK